MITDHPPIVIVAIPFFLLSLGGEFAYLRTRARARGLAGYEHRDTRASLLMGVLSLVVGIVIIIGDIPISLLAWDHRVLDLGDGVPAFVIAMLAWDFSYYWYHRAGHRVRLLWANHVQHHSSEHYNLSTALRQPVTSFSEWLFFPTLAVLGIPPWMIFAAGNLNLIYQYWIHTEVVTVLPRWFEFVFNSPSHHRVHHGSQAQYLDKNYAGILILWDRLLGTFEPEREKVVYGLTKNIHTFRVWRIATHEYASLLTDIGRSPTAADKVRVLLRPPGWQPTPAAPPVAAADAPNPR